MKLIKLIILCLFFSGCATTNKFLKVMNNNPSPEIAKQELGKPNKEIILADGIIIQTYSTLLSSERWVAIFKHDKNIHYAKESDPFFDIDVLFKLGQINEIDYSLRKLERSQEIARKIHDSSKVQEAQSQNNILFQESLNNALEAFRSDNNSKKTYIQPIQIIKPQRLDGKQLIYNNNGNETGFIKTNNRPRLDKKILIYDKFGNPAGYTR